MRLESPELLFDLRAALLQREQLLAQVLPAHRDNPLMVANRILQLDHMTMGRVMFGMGPGLLPTDADMIVVGAFGHTRIRELILGSTTSFLLSRSNKPVMFVR